MDSRDEKAVRAVSEELHLRAQYGSEPDPEVLVRCVREAFTDDVITGTGQTDEQRGRAFLERLRDRRFGDDWDGAYDVLYGFLASNLPPEAIKASEAAALGRVLREST